MKRITVFMIALGRSSPVGWAAAVERTQLNAGLRRKAIDFRYYPLKR
jgi:hypothetical protein